MGRGGVTACLWMSGIAFKKSGLQTAVHTTRLFQDNSTTPEPEAGVLKNKHGIGRRTMIAQSRDKWLCTEALNLLIVQRWSAGKVLEWNRWSPNQRGH